MKISHQWINQYLEKPLTVEALSDKLTILGLEVGSINPLSEDFSGVIVGEIIEAKSHPNADRLKLCVINDGKNTIKVVCGAPNARTGIKIAFAQVGARLPGNFKIKKSKIRGVESNGMLCSFKELGLGDEHDGIIELKTNAILGVNLKDHLQLNDTILDIELTPNRGDCFSLRGILRELSVDNEKDFVDINCPTIDNIPSQVINVELLAEKACPLFSSCIVKDVNCQISSPDWMVKVLTASGIRSINFIVDITNYVMLTLGQPLHAYDLDKTEGNLVVRFASQNEQLTLLDDSSPSLSENLLIISTGNGQQSRPLGLAGIMGGNDCGVTSETKNIIFEAAHFTQDYIIGNARSLGMQTEASMRFERGVDPSLTQKAIQLATYLLSQETEIISGEIITKKSDFYQHYTDSLQPKVELTLRQVEATLGVDISFEQVTKILEGLQIECIKTKENTLTVTSPIHRFDLKIDKDYIEEVARHYGYDKITKLALEKSSFARQKLSIKPNKKTIKNQATNHLASLGFNQCISFSFINQIKQELFFPNQNSMELLNPIASNMSNMRLSLIPSLLENAVFNYNHQQLQSSLFEIGYCFTPLTTPVKKVEDIKQQNKLAFLITNKWRDRHWLTSNNNQEVDFFIIKGVLQSLLKSIGFNENLNYSTVDLPEFAHPGQSANLELSDKKVGCIGMMHPKILKHYDFSVEVAFCELDWHIIAQYNFPINYEKFSLLPKATRDLAVVVNREITIKLLTRSINSWKIKNLKQVNVFDLYQDEKRLGNQKSIGLSFEFQSNKLTLEEQELNLSMKKIQDNLESEFQALIRT